MPEPKLKIVAPEPFKVEAGPPPPSTFGRWNPSPVTAAISELAKAKIGASVFLPFDRPTAFQQAAYRLGGKGWITSRRSDGGFRVWKIAEPKLRA